MEDDQRLNTLVHEGDALRFSVYHCKKPENRCNQVVPLSHCCCGSMHVKEVLIALECCSKVNSKLM